MFIPNKKKIINLEDEEIINRNYNEVTISYKDKLKAFFQEHYLKIFYFIFYLIWLILWVESRLNFIKADDYRIFKKSNEILYNKANFSHETNDFMNNLGKSLFRMFGLGSYDNITSNISIENNTNSLHSHFNHYF